MSALVCPISSFYFSDDQTRVVLRSDDTKDYINASFVQVDAVPNRKYILTQGPLQQTSEHFWQMIWEQKSPSIIMLNRIIEKGMVKCFPYFPQPEHDLQFDDTELSVSCISETAKGSYILRSFVITHDDVSYI